MLNIFHLTFWHPVSQWSIDSCSRGCHIIYYSFWGYTTIFDSYNSFILQLKSFYMGPKLLELVKGVSYYQGSEILISSHSFSPHWIRCFHRTNHLLDAIDQIRAIERELYSIGTKPGYINLKRFVENFRYVV